jgi:hypothetical protein
MQDENDDDDQWDADAGLVCPQCRQPFAVIENRLPRTLAFWSRPLNVV